MACRADHYRCVETEAKIAVSPWLQCEIGFSERLPRVSKVKPEDSDWLRLTSGILFGCGKVPPWRFFQRRWQLITRLRHLHCTSFVFCYWDTLCAESHIVWLAATSVFLKAGRSHFTVSPDSVLLAFRECGQNLKTEASRCPNESNTSQRLF